MKLTTLWKMRYYEDNGITETICIQNKVELGGEYTLCGNAYEIDRDMDRSVPMGLIEEFEGTIDQCTCQNCKKLAYWCKSLFE